MRFTLEMSFKDNLYEEDCSASVVDILEILAKVISLDGIHTESLYPLHDISYNLVGFAFFEDDDVT